MICIPYARLQRFMTVAMERLQKGDLCLILIDQVDEALAHITQRVNSAALAG